MRLAIALSIIAALFLIFHFDATVIALWIMVSAAVRFFGLGVYFLIIALAAYPAIRVVRKAWRS